MTRRVLRPVRWLRLVAAKCLAEVRQARAVSAMCERIVTERKPSPEAVALAKRTPWTYDEAEDVIRAHATVADRISREDFVNVVAATGMSAAEVARQIGEDR